MIREVFLENWTLIDCLRKCQIALAFVGTGVALATMFEGRLYKVPPPRYIYLVCSAFVVLFWSPTIEVYQRLGKPAAFWTPLGIFAVSLGTSAIIALFRYYHPDRRARRHAAREEEGIRQAEEWLQAHRARQE